jgi:hypothetical protein
MYSVRSYSEIFVLYIVVMLIDEGCFDRIHLQYPLDWCITKPHSFDK